MASAPMNAEEPRVKSADRVMAVLDHLGEVEFATFAEIAARLELPKSSAHGLLRTMQSRGYVAFDESRKGYRLGRRIWELAHFGRSTEELRALLKPLMDELRDRTEETVQLAVLEGIEAVYLELSESPHPVKLTSRAGVRLPAYTSAIGKSLLSSVEPAELRRRLEPVRLVRLTPNTITDLPSLLAEIERVRGQGYSVDNEEFAIGLRCVAMPVRDGEGRVVAAMSVSMPTPRYTRTVAAAARRALGETVAAAAARLGNWPG
jgi:DNA-binding IclR family transcriptional regulator